MRRGIKLNLKAIIISQVALRPSSALPVEVTVAAGPPSATAQCKKLAKLANLRTENYETFAKLHICEIVCNAHLQNTAKHCLRNIEKL